MATKNAPPKFDCYAHAKPDEPMFILLARDRFAHIAVREWARLRKVMIATGEKPESDMAMVTEALDCADAMEAWRTKNWPQRKDDGTEPPAPKPAEATAREIVSWLRSEAHRIGFGERRDCRTLLEQVARVIADGKVPSIAIDENEIANSTPEASDAVVAAWLRGMAHEFKWGDAKRSPRHFLEQVAYAIDRGDLARYRREHPTEEAGS